MTKRRERTTLVSLAMTNNQTRDPRIYSPLHRASSFGPYPFAGDDSLEGDEEEAPPPPNAHEVARAWTDQLAKEVFERAGTSPKNVDVAVSWSDSGK